MQGTRAAEQEQNKSDALRLKPGQFLAAQVRLRRGAGRTSGRAAGATVGQNGEFAGESVYWIGRGAPGGRDDGTCIIKDNFTSAREIFEGTLFSLGDVAIAVEWFALHPSDGDGMHYVLWDHVADGNAADTRFVLNSTELRLVGFEMVTLPRISPPLNVTRRSSRSGAQRAVVTAERTIYELSRSTHNAIMATLWPS